MAENKNKNNSKQTLNIVEVIGQVQENKLEKVEEKGVGKIKGSVVIKYGKKADQQVEVSVYQGEFNSDGKTPSKKYEKLVGLIDRIVTIKDADEDTPATVLRINGNAPFCPQVELNEYNSNGEVRSNLKISKGFGNISESSLTEKDFKAEFEMVIYLNKQPKMEKDKLKIEGLYIDYEDKVKPVTFSVDDDEELMEGLENCSKGDTIVVWGDIKVAQITTTKKKKSGFGGKGKTDTDTKIFRELIITGGDIIEEDDKRAIDSKFVKSALVERQTFLEELVKEKAAKKKKSGFGGKGKSANKVAKTKKEDPNDDFGGFQAIDGDDDIPF